MLKFSLPALLFSVILTGCAKNESAATVQKRSANDCYTGIIVKKGICAQRVIQIVNPDNGISFAASWYDEDEKITRKNVFQVENICDFPADLKEGDQFKFSLAASVNTQCATCEAYVAVPVQKNAIKIACN